MRPTDPEPKIELHVHLEGTVRPRALLDLARRNGVSLPVDTEHALAQLDSFRDFEHFIEMWILTTAAIRTEADFREVVVEYAREAAAHGAVYVEAIFSPAERVSSVASWDEVFSGFCDGAEDAERETGVTLRLTPDIPRGVALELAMETARYAIKYRDRGIVGLGLGGLEKPFPPEPYAPAFRLAKDAGLGSVPHAGEVAGVASIRGALDALGADRLRHGIRAVDDAGLMRELAARGIVCDVCPVSNLRTGAVPSVDAHPLATLVAAGVACSISTDDPALFDTDLARDYEVAAALGCGAQAAFRAGVQGALCDDATRARLQQIADTHPWQAMR